MESNVDHVEVFQEHTSVNEPGWRWRAKSANGEIVATSESYTRRDDATRAAQATFPHAILTLKVSN